MGVFESQAVVVWKKKQWITTMACMPEKGSMMPMAWVQEGSKLGVCLVQAMTQCPCPLLGMSEVPFVSST